MTLQDNDTKRQDAEKKFNESKKIIEQKEEELEIQKLKVEALRQEEEEKKSLLEKCIITNHFTFTTSDREHQRYLHSVLERSEEYKEIKFLIERWRVLNDTSENLLEESDKTLLRTEAAKTELQKCVHLFPTM